MGIFVPSEMSLQFIGTYKFYDVSTSALVAQKFIAYYRFPFRELFSLTPLIQVVFSALIADEDMEK